MSPQGQTTHANASEVTITATPGPGWVFAHWEGGLSGNANPATITLDVDRAVTAVFTQISYILNTSVAAGNGTIDPAGETQHAALATVKMTAIPEGGWQFTGWHGDLTSTTNPVTLLMDGPKSVSASFVHDPGEGEGEGEGSPAPPHSADQDGDFKVGLSELLRVIQFYNVGGYAACAEGEDGYCPGLATG